MPPVYPFKAIQYQSGKGDVSALVAPPYDVLDAVAKADLLAKDRSNVVAIDLPHVPAKKLGPPAAYEGAAETLGELLRSGALTTSPEAMFAYRQTFEFDGKQYQRCGMACALDTVPFGPSDRGGVLAHEQTFGGPKEDRLALMKATACQLSPIFGLYPDDRGLGSRTVRAAMDERGPDMTADLGDGVKHEVWTITEREIIAMFQGALGGQDVFVADGHHRYNTALNYLAELQAGGSVEEDHPARRTMFVLVGMSDPGLAIGPTHRVLGGMADYDIEKFIEEAAGILNVEAIDNTPSDFEQNMASIAERERQQNVFGIYDFATGLCFAAWPAVDDPLSDSFDHKPEAWRRLDVAIVQHLIVEEICQPKLNKGEPVKWAFPHTIEEVLAIGRGEETGSAIEGGGRPQLAVIVRPTPLDAVREISRANELMPQKSTFFYPKLATGLFINPLDT